MDSNARSRAAVIKAPGGAEGDIWPINYLRTSYLGLSSGIASRKARMRSSIRETRNSVTTLARTEAAPRWCSIFRKPADTVQPMGACWWGRMPGWRRNMIRVGAPDQSRFGRAWSGIAVAWSHVRKLITCCTQPRHEARGQVRPFPDLHPRGGPWFCSKPSR